MTKTKYLAASHILCTLISLFKKSLDTVFSTAQNQVKFKAFSEFLHKLLTTFFHFTLGNKHLSVTKN